jgi:diguanylate cyclase (GGDEF)-like protein
MGSKATLMSSTRTTFIIISVVFFVCALFILPYYLTQISKQNSHELEVSLFIDQSFSVDIRDAVNISKNEWRPIDSVNLGLNSAPHWLTFTMPSQHTTENRYLLVNYSLLDHVDVWFLTPPEQGSEVVGAYNTGDAYPYLERIIKSEKFLFEVPNSDHDLQVFIRAASKGPVNVPIEIWSANEFIEYSSLQKLFLGLFFGFMMAMALSNLYIYATTRNSLFLVYTAYVTGLAITLASLHGIGFRYIWPGNIWLQELAIPIFSCLTLIFVISLSISLLNLKANSPNIFKMLRSIRYIYIALLVFSFVLPYEIAIKAVLVLLVMCSPFIFISGVILALRGNIIARYFCAAWGVLLLSGLSISMENLGLYDSIISSSYLLMVGAIIEALLLALAISININQQLLHAEKTRDLALKNEQEAIEAKDELINLQEKNRTELEYSIEERTLELEIALRELSEKNRELEKLSAIDPLTGLMNRRYFDKRILAECRRSKREKSNLSIAMLDIDHFKKVNDNYGHLCGDHCLKVFAATLKEVIKRPADIICRYGGEEFVLILPNTDQDGLIKLLEKVRKSVESKKIMFEGQELAMTVSIGGCSRVVLSDDETGMVVAFADKQLYKAKESGRNCVMVQSY